MELYELNEILETETAEEIIAQITRDDGVRVIEFLCTQGIVWEAEVSADDELIDLYWG